MLRLLRFGHFGPAAAPLLPRHLGRAIEIDAQRSPAGPLGAKAGSEVVPVPVLDSRPADLGDRRKARERHELDIPDMAERFRPKGRLHAEQGALRNAGHECCRVPVISIPDLDQSGPVQPENRSLVVLHVEINAVCG